MGKVLLGLSCLGSLQSGSIHHFLKAKGMMTFWDHFKGMQNAGLKKTVETVLKVEFKCGKYFQGWFYYS